MKCADAEKFIALDVEGDLAEARGAALRNHLAVCPSCRQVTLEMRESQQVLKSLRREMLPDSLAERSRQWALEALRTRQQNPGWGSALHPRLRWVYAVGGFAVLAWATIGWMELQKSETPASVADAVGARSEEALPKILKIPGTVASIPTREQSTTHLKSTARNAVPVPLSAASATVARSGHRVAVPPVAPRVEIVSTGLAQDSPNPDSDTTVLKIASNDPNVLLYWVMDSQGGS